MEEHKLLYTFKDEDIQECDTISLCVDIRKSTKLHTEFADKTLSAKIVATFISKCYLVCNNSKTFNNYIYAGDGLIAVALSADNERAFQNVLDVAIEISKIIAIFNETYSIFNAGIGIAFDQTVNIKVKDLPKAYNNGLYVGDSVAISSKICSSLPLKNKRYPSTVYIGMNKGFAEHLPKDIALIKTATKFIYKGD